MRPGIVLLAALAACASAPQPQQAWEAERAQASGPLLDVSRPPPSDLPPGEDPQKPPGAGNYPAPPGGRLLATAAGPVGPPLAGSVALPPELWLPAAPQKLQQAIRDDRASSDLLVDATMQADVDGDGRPELVVLARPAALFETESEDRVALLLALSGENDRYRLIAAHSFAPHFSGGHACHAAWTLAGVLHRGRADVPLVFEERGVECSQLVGGGFDRTVWAVDLGHPGSVAAEAVVARARLGKAGAADLYEAQAWASDIDGDGAEELVTRGIATGARPCGADPAFWVEELAYTARAPDAPVRAVHNGLQAPEPGGVLPPQLLASHPGNCGSLHLPAAR